MLRSVVIISCILLTTCLALGQHLTKPLTNQDVIEMVALGLSDDLIIDKIHATAATNFDTSIAGLKELKVNRVSESLIRAMINAGPDAMSTKAVKVQSSDLGVPIEAGVYLVRGGKPTEVEPEIVNWQTGGVAKKTITLSIVKGDLNGKVARPRSPLQVSTPLEFLIKTLEGTSVTEYQLLRLHEKGDRREFRSITGGVLHQSGGSERDEVSFDAKKVGAAVWRVRVEQLPMGEYGFLAPRAQVFVNRHRVLRRAGVFSGMRFVPYDALRARKRGTTCSNCWSDPKASLCRQP